MTCDTVREALLDYLEAALPPPEREAVAAHLAACDTCRAEAEALRWADTALAPLAAMQEAPAADSARAPWLRAPRPVWRWAALAGAAAGVILLAVLLAERPSGHPRPSAADRREVVTLAPPPAPDRTARSEHVASPGAVRPAPAHLGKQPEAGGAADKSALAIVVVEPEMELPPVSSYYAEVALPDGTTSALTQSISRDQAGRPEEISIAYAQGAIGAQGRE